MSTPCLPIIPSAAHALVKPETASGVKKLTVASCRGFAANDARVHRGCSDAEQKTASDAPLHMNGRIYDSAINRFLQADPVVQAPSFVLSYNRYAYVWNNPIQFVDPSGYYVSTVTAGGSNVTSGSGGNVSHGSSTPGYGGNVDFNKIGNGWQRDANLQGKDQFAGVNLNFNLSLEFDRVLDDWESEYGEYDPEFNLNLNLGVGIDVAGDYTIESGVRITKIDYVSVRRYWVKGDDGTANKLGKYASDALIDYIKTGKLRPSPSIALDTLVHKFEKTTWSLYEVKVNVAQDYVYDRSYWMEDGKLTGSVGFKRDGKVYDHSIYGGPNFIRSEDFINASSGPLPLSKEVDKIYEPNF